MGQYTDTVNEYMEIMEYIEEGNTCNALEAGSGRLTTWFNHGGTSVEILRDGIEYEGTVYKKGDIIETSPTDELYVKYNTEYNSVKPLLESIKNLFQGKDSGN